jgi:hypothetical protein
VSMSRPSVETSYADILTAGVDADLRGIVGTLDRDLTVVYAAEPPPAVRATIDRLASDRREALLAEQAKVRRSLRGRLIASWRRLWTTRRLWAVAVAVALMLITAGAIGYASSQVIRVFIPEQPPPTGGFSDVRVLPNVPIMPFVRYRSIDPARAAQESGLPIAYLSAIPLDLRGTVGTVVYEHGPWLTTDSRAVLRVHSLVRYRGGGHTLIIELSEPSPAIIAKYRILLGNHTVLLANGQPAWTSVFLGSFQPNVVSFVSDQFIVSIASDLSLDRIEQVASDTTVSPEATDPGQRRIPSTWPTPLPADTAVPGVDIAMVGTVNDYVAPDGNLTLQYSLQLGNRGMGQEQNEEITLLLPPGIAFADRTPNDRLLIHFGGGNGVVGGTETLVVTDRSAFGKGITVRVTWTEHGVPGERTFSFPITTESGPHVYP